MASRAFFPIQSAAREVKHVFAKVAIGSSGAPTLSGPDSPGVSSISRTSAGLYVLTLADTYPSLVAFQVTLVDDDLADVTFQVKADAIASTGAITFSCKAGASEAEVADGATLLIHVMARNSGDM
jgi:hypothetical protein